MACFVAMTRAGYFEGSEALEAAFPIPRMAKGEKVPSLGDAIFLWTEDRGLVGEARIDRTHPADEFVVSTRTWQNYEEPHLPRDWLANTKGLPRPLPDDARHFLGARRTHKTRPVPAHYIHEIDKARLDFRNQPR